MEKTIVFDNSPYQLEFQSLKYKKIRFYRKTLAIVIVLKGQVEIDLDGIKIILSEGEFSSINAGIPHSIHSKEDSFIATLYLDLNAYEVQHPSIHGYSFYCLYKKDETDNDEPYLAIRNYLIRLMIIENLKIPNLKKYGNKICDILMNILINHVFDQEFVKNKITVLKDSDRERMFSMTKFMSENYNRKGLSLNDLAMHENLSSTRLSHFWKSVTNISFVDTINMYRYNEARRLLMSRDLSINEIADLCGYSDEKYLYKAIKQNFNMTPGEYRDSFKKMSKIPDEFKIYDVRDIHEIVETFGDRYFEKTINFEFLLDNFQLLKKEEQLNQLYWAIVSTDKKATKEKKIENAAIINFGMNRGLSLEKGHIQINWEYVYAIGIITLALYSDCSIVINIEHISIEDWISVFDSIIGEVRKKWKSDFSTNTQLIIVYGDNVMHDNALELERKLTKGGYFKKIYTVQNL